MWFFQRRTPIQERHEVFEPERMQRGNDAVADISAVDVPREDPRFEREPMGEREHERVDVPRAVRVPVREQAFDRGERGFENNELERAVEGVFESIRN